MTIVFARLQRQLEDALRNHLVSGQRARVPEAGRLVWSWFVALSSTRAVTMAGPQPISYAEMEAYFRLHGIAPRADHLRMLRALDRVFLNAGRTEAPKAAPRPSADINPTIFDAVFG